jgi:hypothetical protein
MGSFGRTLNKKRVYVEPTGIIALLESCYFFDVLSRQRWLGRRQNIFVQAFPSFSEKGYSSPKRSPLACE